MVRLVIAASFVFVQLAAWVQTSAGHPIEFREKFESRAISNNNDSQLSKRDQMELDRRVIFCGLEFVAGAACAYAVDKYRKRRTKKKGEKAEKAKKAEEAKTAAAEQVNPTTTTPTTAHSPQDSAGSSSTTLLNNVPDSRPGVGPSAGEAARAPAVPPRRFSTRRSLDGLE